MNVLLFQPQIPQNTGNIVRLCSVSGAALFLVEPLGFSITNKKLKRAGLDYWEGVEVKMIENLEHFLESTSSRFFFFSSHATKGYTEIHYQWGAFLIFGSETGGIPESFWKRWPDHFYKIPQKAETRCLNLANAVSIVLYEAERQQDFANLDL